MSGDESPLPEVCVVYIQRTLEQCGTEVLLGKKKSGLGKGRYVGPGGKLEPGETARQAAVREVREEVGLILDAERLTLIGELTYHFPFKPEWSQKSWAFLADYPGGEPRESDELIPVWFSTDAIPFEAMWDDAKYWLSAAINGEFVVATFTFGADGRTVTSSNHRNFGP